MSFEKEVLTKVERITKDGTSASFFCGSLSVICTESIARKIYHKLSRDYGLGKVEINRDGSYGYIFDFVA